MIDRKCHFIVETKSFNCLTANQNELKLEICNHEILLPSKTWFIENEDSAFEKFSNKLSLDFELKRRIRSMNEEIERSKENNDNSLKYNSIALEEGYIEKNR